ncbi:MAG: DUF5615 family PIN-like protein, partial [Geminicoccales bacterium]
MRLLADECFDERLAARLRSAGHDVVRVPAHSGLGDLAVAGRAEREDRLLLTQDKDFGAIFLDQGRPRRGVILVVWIRQVIPHMADRRDHQSHRLSGSRDTKRRRRSVWFEPLVRASVADIDRLALRLVRLMERAGDDLSGAITVLD